MNKTTEFKSEQTSNEFPSPKLVNDLNRIVKEYEAEIEHGQDSSEYLLTDLLKQLRALPFQHEGVIMSSHLKQEVADMIVSALNAQYKEEGLYFQSTKRASAWESARPGHAYVLAKGEYLVNNQNHIKKAVRSMEELWKLRETDPDKEENSSSSSSPF